MSNYKRCVECKRPFPEYMVEDYPLILQSPLCPLCARTLTNRMRGKPPGTHFEDPVQQEVHEEARGFISSGSKRPWGGCLLNPPEDCPYRFKAPDGGIWTDLGNCNRSCNAKCSRLWEFKRMSDDERNAYLYENGVIFI